MLALTGCGSKPVALDVTGSDLSGDRWIKVFSRKTHGTSNFYFIDNSFAANVGTSCWHSHPGPSLIFVVYGTITNSMSNGHHCMQQDYSAGQGFVDEGGDMVHKVTNNGSVAARTIAVQFLPAGATRRIEADEPNCH